MHNSPPTNLSQKTKSQSSHYYLIKDTKTKSPKKGKEVFKEAQEGAKKTIKEAARRAAERRAKKKQEEAALRRKHNKEKQNIMKHINTICFITTPYSENRSVFHTNTSRMNNELLKQRLSCIPIHISENDFPIEDYILEN